MKGKLMTMLVIIGVSVVVVAAIIAVLVKVWSSPYANDVSKFKRTFSNEEQARISQRLITSDELADATCQSGHECWIAVDGVVYDVSSIPSWVRGRHHGLTPGQDHTGAFLRSGHGVDALQKLKVVGSYPTGERAPQS